MIGRSCACPFCVAALLALAAVGTVVGAAFYMGLIPSGGGVANGSPTPRGSFVPASIVATPSAAAECRSVTIGGADVHRPTIGGTYTVQPGDS